MQWVLKFANGGCDLERTCEPSRSTGNIEGSAHTDQASPGIFAMRALGTALLCITLGGCWTSGQDAASPRSGDQFVGQNVQVVATRFGQPTGRKKLDGDQMFYVWELPPLDWSGNKRTHAGDGGLYGDGLTPGYMSDDPRLCKISVTTSPEGVVTQFIAEDLNGTGAPATTLGLVGGVCAQRLSKP
jgi:hypothetical protein